MTRLSDEGYAGQIFSGGKDVALPSYNGSAEGGIEEIFLLHFPCGYFPGLRTRSARLIVEVADALPGDELFRRGGADCKTSHGSIALLNLRRGRGLRVEPGDESVLHFVRVAQDVALVEVQDIGEVVYTGHGAIDDLGFDGMLPLPAQKFPVEYFLQNRRPYFHRGFHSLAVGGFGEGNSVDEALGVIGIV